MGRCKSGTLGVFVGADSEGLVEALMAFSLCLGRTVEKVCLRQLPSPSTRETEAAAASVPASLPELRPSEAGDRS